MMRKNEPCIRPFECFQIVDMGLEHQQKITYVQYISETNQKVGKIILSISHVTF